MTDDSNMESAGEAARLDRLLAAAAVPAVPRALERRILADFDKVQARWTLAKALHRAADAIWPDAPAWKPACAFALALFIGLGVAAFAPFDVPQSDDAGAHVFALDGAPDVDAGQGI